MGLPIMPSAPEPHPDPHAKERALVARNLAGVKRKIGVHSGKGGVGKTFVAVNLALALAHQGSTVGILDADIDCPNVGKFLNLRSVPLEGDAEGRFSPLTYKGIKVLSTHFLTDDPQAPMIVRGPIKHKVLTELLTQADWGSLDALIVDLPPGTADVPMSSMLLGALDGMIIVTAPGKESLLDARKSALLAREVGVPVIGVVENMSGEVFGTGAGKALAAELNVPFLGSIPLSREIRELGEKGRAAFTKLDACQEVAGAMMTVTLGGKVDRRSTFWRSLRWS